MNWVVKSTSWTAEAKYLKTKKTYFVLLMVFFLWELMPAGFIAVFVVLWVKKPQYVPKEEVQFHYMSSRLNTITRPHLYI